jgi:hypothetical protein
LPLARLGPLLAEDVTRRERDVVERRQVREQLEVLEHHPDQPAVGAQVNRGRMVGPVADQLIAEAELTTRRLDEQVEAAK